MAANYDATNSFLRWEITKLLDDSGLAANLFDNMDDQQKERGFKSSFSENYNDVVERKANLTFQGRDDNNALLLELFLRLKVNNGDMDEDQAKEYIKSDILSRCEEPEKELQSLMTKSGSDFFNIDMAGTPSVPTSSTSGTDDSSSDDEREYSSLGRTSPVPGSGSSIDIAELQKKLSECEKDKADLLAKLQKCKVEKVALKNRASELEKDNADLLVDLNKCQTEKGDLNNKISNLETEKTDLADKIAELSNEKYDLSTDLTDLQSKYDSLEEDIKASDKKVTAANERYKKALQDLIKEGLDKAIIMKVKNVYDKVTF